MPDGRGAAAAVPGHEVPHEDGVIEVRPRLRPELARRVAAAQIASQLPPVAGLLAVALPRLTRGGAPLEMMLAVAEVATSAILVLAVLRELRGKPLHARIGAVDLAAGAMLLAEWVDAMAHGHKRLSPTLLAALASIWVGLLPLWRPGFRERKRLLRVSAEGIAWRMSRLRHFTVAWREVSRVERDAGVVTILRLRGRRRTIRVQQLENAEEVWDAIATGAARAGVVVREDGRDAEGVGRRAALVRAGALLAAVLLGARRAKAASPGRRRAEPAPHPEPRPGITAERVLGDDHVPDREDVRQAFAAARAWPALFDGIRCACGCAEGMHHRSLLSCFECDQGTWCPGCRRQALYVGELATAGRTLPEIRAAVDARFDG